MRPGGAECPLPTARRIRARNGGRRARRRGRRGARPQAGGDARRDGGRSCGARAAVECAPRGVPRPGPAASHAAVAAAHRRRLRATRRAGRICRRTEGGGGSSRHSGRDLRARGRRPRPCQRASRYDARRLARDVARAVRRRHRTPVPSARGAVGRARRRPATRGNSGALLRPGGDGVVSRREARLRPAVHLQPGCYHSRDRLVARGRAESRCRCRGHSRRHRNATTRSGAQRRMGHTETRAGTLAPMEVFRSPRITLIARPQFLEPEHLAVQWRGDARLEEEWQQQVTEAQAAYVRAVEGLMQRYEWIGDKVHRRKMAREAARSVLPNATEVKIVVSGNARAWRTMLELRCGEGAELEIRRMAIACLRALVREAPALFSDFEIYLADDRQEAARVTYHKV